MTQRDESIQFLLDEEKWPLYPYCPVKRYREQGEAPDHAIVVARRSPEARFIVLHRSVYGKTEADTRVTEYASVGDLLDSGWVVD